MKDFLNKIGNNPIIGVLRAPSKEIALKAIDACIKGGMKNIEITLTTPDAVDVLKEAKQRHTNACIGFGTITNLAEAEMTLISEADFIVSPHTDETLLDFYLEKSVNYIPAGATPSELMHIRNRGFQLQKLFPGSIYGAAGVKTILGPLPMLNLVVTGGIKLENAKEVLESGAKIVCVGSNLFNHKWDIDLIESEARKWSQIK